MIRKDPLKWVLRKGFCLRSLLLYFDKTNIKIRVFVRQRQPPFFIKGWNQFRSSWSMFGDKLYFVVCRSHRILDKDTSQPTNQPNGSKKWKQWKSKALDCQCALNHIMVGASGSVQENRASDRLGAGYQPTKRLKKVKNVKNWNTRFANVLWSILGRGLLALCRRRIENQRD